MISFETVKEKVEELGYKIELKIMVFNFTLNARMVRLIIIRKMTNG